MSRTGAVVKGTRLRFSIFSLLDLRFYGWEWPASRGWRATNAARNSFIRFFQLFACPAPRVNDCIRLDRMSAKFWKRLAHERELWQQGLALVAGVDEAGCGPLAGPVVAAAVVFPRAWLEGGLCAKLRGLNDSKQLPPEQRQKYYSVITSHPEIRYGIASVDVEMIDRINIRQAAWRAMSLALDQLDPRAQHVLVDGLRIKWLPYPQTALVQGDARSYSIAAASVLAKVTRDRVMVDFDKEFPGYGFAAHKGYATPQHIAAIRERGACPIHRKSFWPIRPHATELELFPSQF
jgi:ribonuclease HII